MGLKKGEILMVNIGSTAAGGRILGIKENDLAKVVLTNPVCTQEGDKVALSRRIEKHWRLIGWGQIQKGSTIQPAKQAHYKSRNSLGQRARALPHEGTHSFGAQSAY